MKLNITMNIKANNDQEAQSIVTNTFMNLALNAGCVMACGGVNIDRAHDNVYKVTTSMEASNANNIEIAMQKLSDDPNILNSFAYIASETKQEVEAKQETHKTCKNCGCLLVGNNGRAINIGTENEHYLCPECLEDAYEKDEIMVCGCGKRFTTDMLVKNPVTHFYNLCPICGDILW